MACFGLKFRGQSGALLLMAHTTVIFATSWLGKMTGSHGKSCATQLGQQWISRWFVVRQCQAITWSNVGLQVIRSSRNHLVLYEKHRYYHIHGIFDDLILHKYSTALIDAWALLIYRKANKSPNHECFIYSDSHKKLLINPELFLNNGRTILCIWIKVYCTMFPIYHNWRCSGYETG